MGSGEVKVAAREEQTRGEAHKLLQIQRMCEPMSGNMDSRSDVPLGYLAFASKI